MLVSVKVYTTHRCAGCLLDITSLSKGPHCRCQTLSFIPAHYCGYVSAEAYVPWLVTCAMLLVTCCRRMSAP